MRCYRTRIFRGSAGTVAAVLIVGGTLAEDVITGGGGIADDAASFYLAYRLMFGL
nr:hypothetical protein [uncultured Agathobacter sp.]